MSNYPDDFNHAAYDASYGEADRDKLDERDMQKAAFAFALPIIPALAAHVKKELGVTLSPRRFNEIASLLAETITDEIHIAAEYEGRAV